VIPTDAAPDSISSSSSSSSNNNNIMTDNNPTTKTGNNDRPASRRPVPANDPGSIPLEVSDDMATLVSNDLTAEFGDFYVPMAPLGRPTVSTGGTAPPPPAISQRVVSRDGDVRYPRPGPVARGTIARTGERSKSARTTGAARAEAAAATEADIDVLTLHIISERGTRRCPEAASLDDTNALSKLPPARTDDEGHMPLALPPGLLTPIDNPQPPALPRSDAKTRAALPLAHNAEWNHGTGNIELIDIAYSSSTTTPTRPGRLQSAGRLTAHPGAFSVDGPTADVASAHGPAPFIAASTVNDQVVVDEPSTLLIRASLVPDRVDEPVVEASPLILEQTLQSEPTPPDPNVVVIPRRTLKIVALIATVLIVAFGIGLGLALSGQGSDEADYPPPLRPPRTLPPKPPQNQTRTPNSQVPTSISTATAVPLPSSVEPSTLPPLMPSRRPSTNYNNTDSSKSPWGGGGTGGGGWGGGRPDGGGGGSGSGTGGTNNGNNGA
jgi:uncharacterized membrane protein YgcG